MRLYVRTIMNRTKAMMMNLGCLSNHFYHNNHNNQRLCLNHDNHNFLQHHQCRFQLCHQLCHNQRLTMQI